MSVKNPRVVSISSPKGIEKAIQELQERLAADLTFIDHVFALAETEVIEDEKLGTIIQPVIYQGEKQDKYTLWPNDYLKSYCFFAKEDPITAEYGDAAMNLKYATYTAKVSIIFWLNLKRIDTGDFRHTISKLRVDIMNFVNRSLPIASTFIPLDSYDENMDDIFTFYTPEVLADYPYPKYPNWGMRVEGELIFTEDCYVNNTYAHV